MLVRLARTGNICCSDTTTLTNFSGDDFRGDATNSRRIARKWRATNTNGISSVNVEVNVSSISLPSGFSFALFVDTDGDQNFATGTPAYYDLTGSGPTRTATNVVIPDGATITIGALRRAISFATSYAQGFENTVPFPTLTVELNYPYAASSGIDVTFNYTVTGVTATLNSDFQTSRTSATITAGNASVNLNAGATAAPLDAAIYVINDALQENTETIDVAITAASITNATLGAIGTLTYAILDDDDPRKISFSTATLNQTVGASNIDLDIVFNIAQPTASSSPYTSVDYALGGTAVPGAGNDYIILPSGTAPPNGTEN